MLLAAETQDSALREAYVGFDPSTTASNAAPTLPNGQAWSAIRGRLGYSRVGALRTKPGRPDSPPAISHSCSDKIAAWCRLGCTGAALDHVLDPVFISTLVIGSDMDEEHRSRHLSELERALWKRTESSGISQTSDSRPLIRAGLSGQKSIFAHTSVAFAHAKRQVDDVAASESAPAVTRHG